MNKDIYTDKLAWFKQNEKPEAALLIADESERIKIVLAWTNLNIRCAEKLTELGGGSENEVWAWLWGNARFSLAELKEKIGSSLPESGLENKMKPLIGNRIIYPDGTLNSFVERYLRGQVFKLFEAKRKRPVKKS